MVASISRILCICYLNPARPRIDKSPGIAKSASDKGKTATLTCRATGAPKITFMWSRLGTVLATPGDKYDIKTNEDTRYVKYK